MQYTGKIELVADDKEVLQHMYTTQYQHSGNKPKHSQITTGTSRYVGVCNVDLIHCILFVLHSGPMK